jgi:hypothetical protein
MSFPPSRSTTILLGGKTAQKKPASSYRKTTAPPSESTLPRPESWALRRLVYSPSATLPPSYESLRHCLQLRQNPSACAPCPWVLSFPCHCPSVVGFSSPRFSARCMSYPLRQVFQFLSLMVAVRRALRRAGNAGIPGLLTCVQPPPFF